MFVDTVRVTNVCIIIIIIIQPHLYRFYGVLHEAIVAAIGHATDRRDDRLV